MSLIDILSNYVCKTPYEDLPEAVIYATKDRVLDYLGGAFHGYTCNVHKPILKVLETYGGRNESTVIGEGVKLPCTSAANINSTMGGDMADGSRLAGLHPSLTVIPAVLAVAEARNRVISGRDLILAIAQGYEVMIRVGRAMNPSSVKRGFHLTGIVGSLGSAAAAGKIINLDEESMKDALSIATLLGSGLLAAFKGPHPLAQTHIARACESGIICAMLAQNGLKGYDVILEEAFIPAYSDEYNLDLITRDLGKEYMIPQTYIKVYAGCRHIHAPIDATIYIMDKHNIGIEDIEKIRVQIYSVAIDLGIEDPKTGDDAMFSIPFGISARLIYGDAFPDKFTSQNLGSERIKQLMSKVTVEYDPEQDREYPAKRGAVVEITAKGGQVFSHKL
ncbi:MmgE/PrpD family protein, partial [Candidatus Omnitrophota bacterium]